MALISISPGERIADAGAGVERDGFTTLPAVFGTVETHGMRADIETALQGADRAGMSLELDRGEVRTLYGGVGDVLLIRPLVAHCSNRSVDGTKLHRRILHLEFAASPTLPDGFAWHDFIR